MSLSERLRRSLSFFSSKSLVRSAFFIPAILLLILFVIWPVVQTVVLGFVFHPEVVVRFGENSEGTIRGVVEDVGVAAWAPDTSFGSGAGPDAGFTVNESAFLWLRFNVSEIPLTGRVIAVGLSLFSAAHETTGNRTQFAVAGALDTTPGESWLDSSASWNTYDGILPWTGGGDGGAADRDEDFRVLGLGPTDADGYHTFQFSPDGVSYLRDRLGTTVSLQVYAIADGHARAFVLSEGSDGHRPQLDVVYETEAEAVGLDNYADVLGDRDTLNPDGIATGRPPFGTLFNNFIWTSVHLPFSLLIGLFLALTLQKVKGASVIKSMIFLGMVTPLIVGGIILRFLYESPVGLVPAFFDAIGVESLSNSWLTSSPSTLLFGLIFGSVWLWTGFSMIVYSAGLTTIPTDYFEAARIDGASDWRIFRKITWPLLRPITLVVITMTLLWELKLFDIVIAATNPEGGLGGAADVLALQMFRYGFVDLPPRFADAAVVATLLTVLTLVAAAFLFRRILLGKRKKGGPSLIRRILVRLLRSSKGVKSR